MKIEIGKRYKTRDGHIAFIAKPWNDKYPYSGIICLENKLWLSECETLWDKYGKCPDGEAHDLVEGLDD